jgi:hypothetical protein
LRRLLWWSLRLSLALHGRRQLEPLRPLCKILLLLLLGLLLGLLLLLL